MQGPLLHPFCMLDRTESQGQTCVGPKQGRVPEVRRGTVLRAGMLGVGPGLTWLQLVQLDMLGCSEHNAVVGLPERNHGRLCQGHLWGPEQRPWLGRLLDHLGESPERQ